MSGKWSRLHFAVLGDELALERPGQPLPARLDIDKKGAACYHLVSKN